MCFSAGASFGAAAVLGVAGAVTISKARKNPTQCMFSAMPLLFALQQVCEGFEWLSFSDSRFEHLRLPMMYAFLVFAQVLWPSWVPVSVWLMEPDRKRRKFLGGICVIGFAGSALLACRLILVPVSSDIQGHHIRYTIESPEWIVTTSSICYFISTLVAPFSSTLKHMRMLGTVMLLALIVTQIFYSEYLISVWCFFAAILSVIIFFVLAGAPDRSRVQSLLPNRIHPDKPAC